MIILQLMGSAFHELVKVDSRFRSLLRMYN